MSFERAMREGEAAAVHPREVFALLANGVKFKRLISELLKSGLPERVRDTF